jgi:glycosyltransferase involved in cell wall biosynthesis
VLEAFAEGVPVVASDAGGTPELVSDESGFRYPWGDLDALERAVHSALDPSRAAVAIAGGRRIAERLTPAAMAAATADALDEVARGSRS